MKTKSTIKNPLSSINDSRKTRWAVVIALIFCSASLAFAVRPDGNDPNERPEVNWRRQALQTMRVASADHFIREPADLQAYLAAGFNTLVVFDATGYNESGTAWNLKTEDEIRAETSFAREKGLPMVLGMAVEPYTAALWAGRESSLTPYARRAPFAPTTNAIAANGLIPQATDEEIRERVELWMKYGDDVIVGVFPWYDDVFWQTVDVDRQRHVYQLIKDIAPDWFVFGMIGEFGFNATDDEVARYYDPASFDDLIVLMYPFSVGAEVTGFPLDNVASSDPDGDMTRYVDRYIARMDERFFRQLTAGQSILLVGQAFYYPSDAAGHIPRPKDIEIMMQRGTEQLRKIAGQQRNQAAGYYYWGSEGSSTVGLSQRSDWLAAVRGVNQGLERRGPRVLQP
jgi:hypothetical protein